MITKAKRENPDKTVSEESVGSGSVLFVFTFVGRQVKVFRIYGNRK